MQSLLRAQKVPAARAPRLPGERGELAVGDDLAARQTPKHVDAREVERAVLLEVELDVGELDRLAGEERLQAPD